MFWRNDAELAEAKKEIERLKTLLEEERAAHNEANEEIKRLKQLVEEKDAKSIGELIDEWVNGPKEDRTEVQPWATSK